MIHQVSTAGGLTTALQSAADGDVIELAAGSYGDVALSGIAAASGITIRSADAGNPARFHFLHLTNCTNLTLDGLSFEHALATGEANYASACRIDNSSGIAVVNSNFQGSIDGDDLDDGTGLLVLGSTGISVAGNEFHDLLTGSSIGTSTGVTVTGNSYHDIGNDGAAFGCVSNVVLSGNSFSDFHTAAAGSSYHPDMIQFFNSNATQDMQNILIAGNTLAIGATGSGVSPQGIFIQGQSGAYIARNVTIEGNTIDNGSQRGISVAGANDLAIAGNTIIRNASAPQGYAPGILLSAIHGATIIDNAAPAFSEVTSSDVFYDGNTVVGTSTGQAWTNEIGTSGADTIIGTTGNNKLTGGAGTDDFVVSAGSTRDYFLDFVVDGPQHDLMDLTALGLAPGSSVADFVLSHTTVSGGISNLSLGAGTPLIQLAGVDLRTFSAAEIAAAFKFT